MPSFRIVLICLLFFAVKANAQQSPRAKKSAATSTNSKIYVTAVTKTGEDVAALLSRYSLFDYACNVKQFFKINNLREGTRIKATTMYKLPIEVVAYNGKSIRTTLSIPDWQTAKRIEVFNRNALEGGLRNDNFIETKRLWVPWHELNCPDDAKKKTAAAAASLNADDKGKKKMIERPMPAGLGEKGFGKDSRNFSIFGKGYQYTPLISNKLKGKVYYLVSGHGGPDSGAQGKRSGHTICEDEYAYDVTLRLLRLLISHGATAYMIVRDPNDGIRDDAILRCDEDEFVWGKHAIPREQKSRLQQRTDLINELYEQNLKHGLTDQSFVEIHVDSRTRDTKIDVFFYYRPGDDESKLLANKMHNTFRQKYLKKRAQRGYGGTVTPRNLFMLKETKVPKSAYVELANIRNDWDQQRLVVKSNRQALANWLCESLLNH
jgi:N-acetylmuramoyl-L-alanine amidase